MKLSAGTGQENFLIRWTLKHNHIFLHSLQISDILNSREIQLQQEIETVVWKLPSKVGLHWICSTIGGTRPPVNRSKYSTELQERKQAVPAPPYPSRAQVVVARQSTRGLITPADILIHDLWRRVSPVASNFFKERRWSTGGNSCRGFAPCSRSLQSTIDLSNWFTYEFTQTKGASACDSCQSAVAFDEPRREQSGEKEKRERRERGSLCTRLKLAARSTWRFRVPTVISWRARWSAGLPCRGQLDQIKREPRFAWLLPGQLAFACNFARNAEFGSVSSFLSFFLTFE